jgi:flagellar basal-body rod protein FlgG
MGTFQQGMLEGSNVNLVEEMTQMIIAQRAYQFNSRSVQVADEMWGMANNLRK